MATQPYLIPDRIDPLLSFELPVAVRLTKALETALASIDLLPPSGDIFDTVPPEITAEPSSG